MKAARIHAYGHSDQILVEDVSRPAPGSQEILVRIRDAGVNPVDWKIREGYMAKVAPARFPLTLGQDFCGEVIALGDGASGVAVGDAVYGFARGTYAEYAIALPDEIARKPGVADEIAAALPTPGLTALQIVAGVVQPSPGQTVLIHGAAGSVGSIATQLCLARGARVIATAAAHDAAYLTLLRVSQVIDYEARRFEHEVRDVDAVVDTVGRDVFERSLGVLRKDGVIVTTVGPTDLAKGKPVRAVHLVMRKDASGLVELARLVDQRVIEPRAAHVLPLDAARQAQELVQTGRSAEKLVLATT
jgi:NADPH:quinone reductase-like Zn-dependent oxidoreductase